VETNLCCIFWSVLRSSAGTKISPKFLRESLKYFFLGLTHSQLTRISLASHASSHSPKTSKATATASHSQRQQQQQPISAATNQRSDQSAQRPRAAAAANSSQQPTAAVGDGGVKRRASSDY
jgi:hypothetical protein